MTRHPIPYPKWLARWKRAGSPAFPEHRLIQIIYWVDAAGDTNESEITPVSTLAVGFLTEANKRFVKLAMEVFEDGSAREFLVIPAKMVTRIADVARAEV